MSSNRHPEWLIAELLNDERDHEKENDTVDQNPSDETASTAEDSFDTRRKWRVLTKIRLPPKLPFPPRTMSTRPDKHGILQKVTERVGKQTGACEPPDIYSAPRSEDKL